MGILVYIYTSLLQSYHGLGIQLQPVLFLSVSWMLAGATELVGVIILVVYSAVLIRAVTSAKTRSMR